MVRMSVEYQGQLRCAAVHGPSGSRLETDAPVDNHGRGETFSPTDLVATALAACMATTMGIVAERHQVDLKGMRLEVTKEMATETPRRIARLPVDVHMPIPRSADPGGRLEKAARACPVHHSLHPEVEVPVTFHWAD